jgi:RHS repeat-associated protein
MNQEGENWFAVGAPTRHFFFKVRYIPTFFYAIFIIFSTNAFGSQKFNLNDLVQANTNCNVRSSATIGNNVLFLQGIGSIGTVQSGPVTSSGYNWYYIAWNNNTTNGWSADTFLNLSPPVTVSPGDSTVPGPITNTLTPQFIWQSVHGATGYGLYIRNTDANVLVYPNSAGNTTTSLTGTSFSLPSGYLLAGTHYKWNLTSFSGTTEYTPPASGNFSRWFITGTLPAAPSFVEAEGINNYIVVAWADNSANEAGFSVERKTTATGSYSQIATVPANTTWFTNNTGLSQGVVYYYRVQAYNGIGYSGYGNETYASLLSLPNAPSGLTATDTVSGISLTWQDNSSNESGFLIQKIQGSLTNYISVAANQTNYADTSVSSGTEYCYLVAATNSSGSSAFTSEQCITYTAAGPAPTATIAGSLNPVTGTTTYYGRYSTGTAPLRYSWSTSDGQHSTDTDPRFTFNSSGSYWIALTVSDSFSRSDTASIPLNVQASNNGVQTFVVAIGADPVVLSTGNYIQNRVDLRLPGKGFPFEFRRFYNSQFSSQTNSPLGYGWTFSYNERLQIVETNVLAIQGDGSAWTFSQSGSGYVGEPGIYDILVNNAVDGTWTLTDKNQTVKSFDANGRLVSIRDKNGNTLTCAYTGGVLSAVTNSAGYVVTFAANEIGCITNMADPAGRTVQFQYDSQTNLAAVIDADNRTNKYFYNEYHQITNAIDGNGVSYIYNEFDPTNFTVTRQCDAYTNWTYFAYDFTNRITWQTNALGKVSVHYFDDRLLETNVIDEVKNQQKSLYDSNRNRIYIKDKNGNETSYGFDSLGNVITKTDALNNVTTIQYDSLNNPVRRVDALTNITTFAYDSRGNLTSTTNALSLVSSVQYDSSGLPIIFTDARGNSTTNQYDLQGNLTNVIDANGEATRFIYDGVGRKVQKIDPLNHSTSFAYDNDDNLLFTTNALNFVNAFTYDANNNRTSSTDPRASATTNIFDLKDRLVAVLAPLNQTNGTLYDALDRKIATFDALGNQTSYTYDDIGNLIAVTNALNQVTRFTFDPQGNQTSVIDPTGHYVTNFFDALNRKIATIDVSISTNFITYDALGRVGATTNANGQVTQFFYDPIGRLTNVVDAVRQSVFFIYDQNGNRIQTTDANGHSWTNVFDKLNRQVEQDDPVGNKTILSYDPVGNLTNKVTPNNDSISYDFDSLSRLINIAHQSATPITFAYDSVGNRTNMMDSLGTTVWQYDLLNRLTSATDPYGQTIANSYDHNGNRISLTYPGSKIVNYGFDVLNRMTALTNWLNGVVTYAYDNRGNLLAATNANSTTVSYGYDVADRLVGITNAAPDASVIAAYALTLDGVGNHMQATHNQPLFPILSNQTNNYAYDSDNRLVTIDGHMVTHNGNGDLTGIGTNFYSYDFEDRLVQLSITNTFTYDGLGNRLARMVNGQNRRFVLDRLGALTQMLVENDTNNSPVAYYVYGLGLTERISADKTVSTYHFNLQGSAIALTDLSGNVTDSYAYDSFGILANSDGDSPQPFRYLGLYGIVDDSTGLLYARARYFSPQLGRFLTKDIATSKDNDGQSLNRFVYALNNPLRFRDATGLVATEGNFLSTLNLSLRNLILPEQREVLLPQKTANSTAAYIPAGSGINWAQVANVTLIGVQVAGEFIFLGPETLAAAPEEFIVEDTTLKAAEDAGANASSIETYLNGSGGRWGNSTTRALNGETATGLENSGSTVINGAGRGSEEWIPGPNGGTTGGTWVDITAINEDGSITRVQTVDTLGDGITPTAREEAAAGRIRAAFPDDELILIPK